MLLKESEQRTPLIKASEAWVSARRPELPLFEVKCPAGFPSPAADYAESELNFHNFLVSRPAATFIFTVTGDSMCNAGILDGDKIAVDRSIDARHGHIVVAIVNGEHTAKRLYLDGGRIELRAENPNYPPIVFKEGDELHIFGVVVGIARKLRV